MSIEEIIEKWLSGREFSDAEKALLDEWMLEPENRKSFFELQRIRSAVLANKMSAEINPEKSWKYFTERLHPSKKYLRFLPHSIVAAMVIVSIGILFRLLTGQYETQSDAGQSFIPNPKQAVLTLSNGQKIILSDSLTPMAEKNGTTIHTTSNQLVYAPTDTASLPVYNTITIPRGGEYKLVLADNTIVWLNSESQLTYPVAFNGDTRELQLKGEAFFKVTKDIHKPFIVHTSQFDIRVTGTQFNVRTYPEERESATLAEGSIQLEMDHRVYQIVPGQQAYLEGQEVKIKKVDLYDAIAWRYDAFSFKEEPLGNIMNELSRWYDVHIFYLNPAVKNLHFTAWFRRNSSLEEVIDILKKTRKINVELKGKTLTVREF